MDVIQYLRKEKAEALDAMRQLMNTLDEEGRGLTEDERKQVTERKKAIADLEQKIEDERDKERMRQEFKLDGEIVDDHPVREPARAVRAKTIGDALVQTDVMRGVSATFKAGQRREFKVPPVEVDYPTRRVTKAADDPVLESGNTELFGTGGNVGALATALGLETPGFSQYRLTIEDLFTTVPVTVGNGVFYPVVDTRNTANLSNNPISDTEAKPGVTYKFDMVNKVLETRAAWVKVHESFLEDAPGLAAYINADLPFMVRQNVEAYIAGVLYDDATNSGSPDDGSSIVGDNGFDAILASQTAIQEAGGNPDALVITPTDWAFLRASKFDGGSEEYVGGGPFTPTNNPWGLRAVVTPSATAGLPIVVDTAAAKVYRRGGMSVTSTNSDQDDFIHNLITVRAETRLVFGVTYPEWVRVAEIGSPS